MLDCEDAIYIACKTMLISEGTVKIVQGTYVNRYLLLER
jgi:hypothetical protein